MVIDGCLKQSNFIQTFSFHLAVKTCVFLMRGTYPALDILQHSVIWAERAGCHYLAELAEVETGPHQGRKCDQADEGDW